MGAEWGGRRPPQANWRLRLAGGLVATAAVIGLSCQGPEPMTDRPAHPTSTTECQEDMACWDCQTMGNHICGPIEPQP